VLVLVGALVAAGPTSARADVAAPLVLDPPPAPPPALRLEPQLAPAPPPALRLEPQPPPAPVYPRRMLLEETLALVAGVIWYRADSHFNKYDWDFNATWSNVEKRLITFDAVRFDDNAFGINALVHPLEGVGYYLIARGNRLPPVQSFLVALTVSAIWEWIIEYREVVSINDMIATPVSGLALGEPFVRFSAFLRAGSPGPLKEVLATMLNPLDAVNGWAEGRPRAATGPTDAYGLPLLYRHRLELGVAYSRADFGAAGGRNEARLAIDLFVDATPALRYPGVRTSFVGPGALNWLAGSLSAANPNTWWGRVFGEVALAGRLRRQASGAADVDPTSSQRLFLGLGTGVEYASRSFPGAGLDQLAIIRLAGPLVDWGLARPGLELHLVGDLLYDFGMVRALALPYYVAAHGTELLSSVLALHGYYYAQGGSASLRFTVEYGRLEVGAILVEDALWIIRSRDRFHTPTVPSARERRGTRHAWLAWRLWPRAPFRAVASFEDLTRQGSLGEFQRRQSELRFSAGIDVKF